MQPRDKSARKLLLLWWRLKFVVKTDTISWNIEPPLHKKMQIWRVDILWGTEYTCKDGAFACFDWIVRPLNDETGPANPFWGLATSLLTFDLYNSLYLVWFGLGNVIKFQPLSPEDNKLSQIPGIYLEPYATFVLWGKISSVQTSSEPCLELSVFIFWVRSFFSLASCHKRCILNIFYSSWIAVLNWALIWLEMTDHPLCCQC